MSETEGAGYDIPDIPPEPVRARSARLKRWWKPTAILVVLSLAGWLVRVPLTLTYPCQVLPAKMDYVRSPLTATVAKIHVKEGQTVQKGAQLAELSSLEWKVAVTRSESNLARAQAELALLQKGARPEEQRKSQERVRGLKKQLQLAKQRTRRLAGLSKQSLAPMEELMEARRTEASLDADLATAEAEWKVVAAGSREEEIEKKKAEIAGLEAQLEFDRRNMEFLVVTAKHGGTVSTPKLEERVGSRVNTGDTLMEVVTLEKMLLEIFVAERDFDALRLGLPVQFRVEAYPTKPFQGVVASIAEKVEKDTLGNKVSVRVWVDNPEGLLRPNMTGYAAIQSGNVSLFERISRSVVRWFRVRFLV